MAERISKPQEYTNEQILAMTPVFRDHLMLAGKIAVGEIAGFYISFNNGIDETPYDYLDGQARTCA